MALEKISESELEPGDVRRRWRTIRKIGLVANALFNFQIVTNSGRNLFTLTESNAVLELDIQGGGTATAAADKTAWQPYLAPYTGTGEKPENWDLNIMVRRGTINEVLPIGNENVIIPVPPSIEDAFHVWMEHTINSGGKITGSEYKWGTALPDEPAPPVGNSAGAPPSKYRVLLFTLQSTETAATLPPIRQYRTEGYSLDPIPIAIAGGVVTRQMRITPPARASDYPTVVYVPAPSDPSDP